MFQELKICFKAHNYFNLENYVSVIDNAYGTCIPFFLIGYFCVPSYKDLWTYCTLCEYIVYVYVDLLV